MKKKKSTATTFEYNEENLLECWLIFQPLRVKCLSSCPTLMNINYLLRIKRCPLKNKTRFKINALVNENR